MTLYTVDTRFPRNQSLNDDKLLVNTMKATVINTYIPYPMCIYRTLCVYTVLYVYSTKEARKRAKVDEIWRYRPKYLNIGPSVHGDHMKQCVPKNAVVTEDPASDYISAGCTRVIRWVCDLFTIICASLTRSWCVSGPWSNSNLSLRSLYCVPWHRALRLAWNSYRW